MTNQDLYLGLDLSTQQLKCTVMDNAHSIVLEEAVNFDRDLPEFGTKHGAFHNGDQVTSPTLMWVKALDILLERLKGTGRIHEIRGISGAGQVRATFFSSLTDIRRAAVFMDSIFIYFAATWKCILECQGNRNIE